MMPKTLFQLLPDERKLGTGYIEGTHRWGLPGVTCPVCGETWTSIASEYPAVDLSGLPNEAEYRTPRNVKLAEYEMLQKPLLKLVPEGAMLQPGSEFGPFVGSAKGKFKDFAWVHSWTLLIQAQIKENLESLINLPLTVRPELISKTELDLLELQLERHGKIRYEGPFEPPCERCLRDPNPVPENIVLDSTSIPNGIDIFRSRTFATVLLGTERFANAVANLGLVGIEFREVTID